MTESIDKAGSAAVETQELRSGPRHEFPYVQKVAPMVGGKLPSAEKFFPVRCRNVSGGGIAVVLDSPPDFDQLVIALGVSPSVRHVTARVVRTERFEENGWTRYLVGCQFIGRVRR